MADPRLVVGLAFNVAMAVFVAFIGLKLLRQRAEGAGRRAITLYATWWIALGIQTFLGVVVIVAGRSAWTSPGLIAGLVYVQLTAIVAMLWGLMYYLVYLFTGRPGTFVPVTAFYAVTLVGAIAFIALLGPQGVAPSPWGGAVTYVNEPSPTTAVVFWLALLGPLLIGATAYGTLFFRLRAPLHRYRVGLISTSIIVWFVAALVLSNGLVHPDVDAVLSKLVALAAIGAIHAAYWPPAAVRARLGVSERHAHRRLAAVPGATEGVVARRVAEPRRAARREALNSRAADLV